MRPARYYASVYYVENVLQTLQLLWSTSTYMVMLSLLVDLNTSSTTVSNCMGLDIMLILKMHLYVPFYVGVLSHTITNVVLYIFNQRLNIYSMQQKDCLDQTSFARERVRYFYEIIAHTYRQPRGATNIKSSLTDIHRANKHISV